MKFFIAFNTSVPRPHKIFRKASSLSFSQKKKKKIISNSVGSSLHILRHWSQVSAVTPWTYKRRYKTYWTSSEYLMDVQFTSYVQGECGVKFFLSKLCCYIQIRKNEFCMLLTAGTMLKCLLRPIQMSIRNG